MTAGSGDDLSGGGEEVFFGTVTTLAGFLLALLTLLPWAISDSWFSPIYLFLEMLPPFRDDWKKPKFLPTG